MRRLIETIYAFHYQTATLFTSETINYLVSAHFVVKKSQIIYLLFSMGGGGGSRDEPKII